MIQNYTCKLKDTWVSFAASAVVFAMLVALRTVCARAMTLEASVLKLKEDETVITLPAPWRMEESLRWMQDLQLAQELFHVGIVDHFYLLNIVEILEMACLKDDLEAIGFSIELVFSFLQFLDCCFVGFHVFRTPKSEREVLHFWTGSIHRRTVVLNVDSNVVRPIGSVCSILIYS